MEKALTLLRKTKEARDLEHGEERGKRKEAFAAAEEGGWGCMKRGLVGQEWLGSLAAATAAAVLTADGDVGDAALG